MPKKKITREEAQKEIIKNIQEVWTKFPEWRFGQLLINMGLAVDDSRVWNKYDEETLKHIKLVRKIAKW